MKNLRLKKAICILTGTILLFLAVCAGTGIFVYQVTIHAADPERRSLDMKKAVLAARGFDTEALESQYHVRTVRIASTFGSHKIPANYLTVDGNQNRDTVVLAHGLNGNRLTGYPVAALFLKHGYNVLTYDQRDSGESPADYVTYGYWESRDFKDCVAYVKKKVGQDKLVGAWGSSIGGATVSFYLGTKHANENLDFAVLDCPVSDMRQIISFFSLRDKADFLPMDFKLAMGDLATRLKLGFSYEDADARRYIKKTSVPVLIFHSKADGVTPWYMGRDLYLSIGHDEKEIYTEEDSRHVSIYWDDPKLYEKRMMGFIDAKVM